MDKASKRGYIIEIDFNDLTRPRYHDAVFLIPIEDGYAWIEPQYLDVMNAGHASHQYSGIITETKNQLVITNDRGTITISDGATDEALSYFRRLLKKNKTTFKKEFKRMLAAFQD